MPQATGQLSLCATTTEPRLQSLRAAATKAWVPWSPCCTTGEVSTRRSLSPAAGEQPPLSTARESCMQQGRPTQPNINKWNFLKVTCSDWSVHICISDGGGWGTEEQWPPTFLWAIFIDLRHWIMYNTICEMNHQSRFDAWYRMLRAGALGWPRGMVWGRRWEGSAGWGTHVHPWRIHVDVWQNQYNIVK